MFPFEIKVKFVYLTNKAVVNGGEFGKIRYCIMADNYIDSSVLDRAICFAVEAHRNTVRRGKGFPYIVHPMEALSIVATLTANQELLAAAVLHDTVEDSPVSVEDIRREFGERVAGLVKAESDVQGSWHERKKAAIEKLAAASLDVKIVAMGDKLSNMRAIARDYERQGDELWKIFCTSEKKDHEWHYRGLAESLSPLAGTEAYREFTDLIDKVFGS